MTTPQEKQLALMLDAVRGAMANLSVALQIGGTLLHPPAEQKQDEDRPKHFGGGAGVRPTTAVEAESQHTED